MRKKKVPTSPAVEVTSGQTDLSRIPIKIDGKSYNLSFELGDLAEAEMHFRGQGHKVNLLVSLPELSLESVRVVFPCAVRKFHPDLTFEQAQALVTLQSVYPIATAIVQAWDAASSKNAAPAE